MLTWMLVSCALFRNFFFRLLNTVCCSEKNFPSDTCAVGTLFHALCRSHSGDVSIRIKDNPVLRLANKLLPNRVRAKKRTNGKKYRTYVTFTRKKNNRLNVQDVVFGMAKKNDTHLKLLVACRHRHRLMMNSQQDTFFSQTPQVFRNFWLVFDTKRITKFD